jgi:alpha,alpha-trehalase
MKVNISTTLAALLAQEDTDGDKKITIEDKGPGRFVLEGDGDSLEVVGTYQLSNLLQELVLARQAGMEEWEVDASKLIEQPVERISRMIREYYWKGLTRTMDESGLQALVSDTKNESLVSDRLRVYVPFGDKLARDYYRTLTDRFPIEVVTLPERISPEYVRGLNDKPGILSLQLEEDEMGIKGVPFVVPGGRFNEMYGWDSYFESVGLMLDGKVDLAGAMADNFRYQIEHYGKILNANRSYYLTRTQPPFYSSLIREVFDITADLEWLKKHLVTAFKEYFTVWMVPGKRLTEIGLNRYLAEGIGITPEAEEGHYDAVLRPYAQKHDMELEEFILAYSQGAIQEPELDTYFVHDRTVRESGHDTSYRIEGICADLVPVELNAMLYKYEMDFAYLIEQHFNDCFSYDGRQYDSQYWKQKARKRRSRMDDYLWDERSGSYLDYYLPESRRHPFVSATALSPLWAGMASGEQAARLVADVLPKLMEKGGIASCDEASRGEVGKDRPQRQWDYPNGWAPHQMMIWRGLDQYGFSDLLQECVYRWLYMITRNAVDYNGTIPEKYDVVAATHKVFAEYGNVGTEFEYITQEGFGWMNASYQYGLSQLEDGFRNALNALTPPEKLF